MTINYQKLIDSPLSSADMYTICRKLATKPNLLILADMQNINSLEDVFKGFDHAIIFVSTTSEMNGHWQLLLRNASTLFFFDSYGHNFTKLLVKVFNNFGKNAYGESYKLGELIAESSYFKTRNALMNTVDYQSMNPKDSTCGRHCLTCFAFWLQSKNSGFSFGKYKNFMDNYMQQNGLKSYDEVVVSVTEKIKKS